MAGFWKDGKRWVYSITYDEGCRLLLEHALPVHRRHDVPGHVALVASQIGVPRNVPGSTYDGMMILSREELAMLATEGWGVSCHGMTHGTVTDGNADVELRASRLLVEQAVGRPVPMFCVPGDNSHFPAIRANAHRSGYAAVMTIYDEVNPPDVDLLRLCRCPLHTRYPGPFFSVYDPYKRLHQAADLGGWVIDYCHCPMPGKPLHEAKDCTLEELDRRFATVRRLGGDEVWIAEPNEVVAYLQRVRGRST
jgi:peptidoglycan/xylan/chitin deacetylase (PgdA/CDA1 family)